MQHTPVGRAIQQCSAPQSGPVCPLPVVYIYELVRTALITTRPQLELWSSMSNEFLSSSHSWWLLYSAVKQSALPPSAQIYCARRSVLRPFSPSKTVPGAREHANVLHAMPERLEVELNDLSFDILARCPSFDDGMNHLRQGSS